MIQAVFIDYMSTTVDEHSPEMAEIVHRICKNSEVHDPKQVQRLILGDRPVCKVTTADVQALYREVQKNGRKTEHPEYGYAPPAPPSATSTVYSIRLWMRRGGSNSRRGIPPRALRFPKRKPPPIRFLTTSSWSGSCRDQKGPSLARLLLHRADHGDAPG